MKMNKKLVVSSLAICMGAGLVGSVSGTVAWYQYSTRSAVNMMGASVGVSKVLEIGIGGDGHELEENDASPDTATVYKSSLSIDDITSFLADEDKNVYGDGTKFSPITAGGIAKNAELDYENGCFYGNPIAGVKDMENWIAAENTDFVVLPLHIRAVEIDATGKHYVARKVGMSDVSIDNNGVTNNENGKTDITDAVRVHVNCGSNNALIANVGETTTCGYLDLDGDGEADVEPKKYEWEERSAITYGVANSKQTSYNLIEEEPGNDLLVNDVYDKENNPKSFDGGLVLGTTPTTNDGLDVNVVVWLEGWQEMQKTASDGFGSVWSALDYIGSQFYLGITFCAEAEA